MSLDKGPVPQGAGLLLEPLGILQGRDAAQAIAAGIALPLAGGPAAFTMVRIGGAVMSVAAVASMYATGLASLSAPVPDWAGLGAGPLVMGILNTTPDSFSDGGDWLDPDRAIAAGLRMLEDGADLIDVGGESTRPGAVTVPLEQEQARVLPVIAALARHGAVVSVDTRNAATMERGLDAGARIVNDVSGLTHDPLAATLVARRRCPVVLVHSRGTPATMAGLAVYANVAGDVADELAALAAAAQAAGVRHADIMLDPGFGFAKTASQNIELMDRLPRLLGLGWSLLAGLSRKATIGALAHQPDPARRGPGSVAGALLALGRGARVLRVHDVAATVQAVRVWTGFTQDIP